jgi:hypothetical protein
MVDYFLLRSVLEISASGCWDTTLWYSTSVCGLHFWWVSVNILSIERKKPCYLSLFNSSFSTFELLKPPKRSSQICGRLHTNFAYFQTKTFTNTEIYDSFGRFVIQMLFWQLAYHDTSMWSSSVIQDKFVPHQGNTSRFQRPLNSCLIFNYKNNLILDAGSGIISVQKGTSNIQKPYLQYHEIQREKFYLYVTSMFSLVRP